MTALHHTPNGVYLARDVLRLDPTFGRHVRVRRRRRRGFIHYLRSLALWLAHQAITLIQHRRTPVA